MAIEKRKGQQPRSAVVRFHRWVGLFSFIVLLVIAATGVLLNHSSDLRLEERTVSRPWVMNLYGMEPVGEPVAFEAGGRRVAGWGGAIFFDGAAAGIDGDLVGAAALGEEIAIVCRDGVSLVDSRGALIERVSGALLPDEPIEAVAPAPGGGLLLRAGGRTFRFEPGAGELPFEGPEPSWAAAAAAGAAERGALLEAWRGEGLPLSRVLLDLHSGRIFGRAGVLVYDLAALAVLLLSATGLWLAVRNFYRSGRSRGQGDPGEPVE